jgi:hypothetical protein
MIKVVDRIGKTHAAGDMVYAYYDTYKSEYIVLDKYEEVSTPTIYGQWDGTTIKVEGLSGITTENNIDIGSSITVENTLNLTTPDEDCTVRGVAIKFLTSDNPYKENS